MNGTHLTEKIVRECSLSRCESSNLFATLVIALQNQKLQSKNENLLDNGSTKEAAKVFDENALINSCVRSIMNRTPFSSLTTLKMQVDFEVLVADEEQSMKSRSIQMHSKISKIENEIMETSLQSSDDYESLSISHELIVDYLQKCHFYDRSIANQNAEDIKNALESVVPMKDLTTFISLSRKEKISQLRELSNIIFGIRYFNEFMGLSSTIFHSVRTECEDQLKNLLPMLLREVNYSQMRCVDLERCALYLQYNTLSQDVKPKKYSTNRLNDIIIYERQYLQYLQFVAHAVLSSEQKVKESIHRLQQNLEDIKLLTEDKVSVLKEDVYPKFIAVSKSWNTLYHELSSLKSSRKIFRKLREFDSAESVSTAVEIFELDKIVFTTWSNSTTVHDFKRSEIASSDGEDKGFVQVQTTKLSIESSKNFMQLSLQFEGFCPVTITQKDGLLLPGNPELGVQNWNSSNYVFFNEDAFECFRKEPDIFIGGVLNKATEYPALIHLLKIQKNFPNFSIYRLLNKDIGESNGEKPEKCNASTLTPTHFVEKCIDHNYTWNQWDMRRRILQSLTLTKCKTKGQQTNESHFRRESKTQVWLRRHKDMQTLKTSSTHPIKKIQHLCAPRSGDDGTAPKTWITTAVRPCPKLQTINLSFDI